MKTVIGIYLLLIILKALKLISMSWWVITLPLWIGPALCVGALLIAIPIVAVMFAVMFVFGGVLTMLEMLEAFLNGRK